MQSYKGIGYREIQIIVDLVLYETHDALVIQPAASVDQKNHIHINRRDSHISLEGNVYSNYKKVLILFRRETFAWIGC